MDRAVAAARQAFDQGPWPTMAHAERAGFLRGIAAGLRERADDIGQIWPRESGALHLIARTAPAGTAAAFDYYADLAETFPFEERAQPSMGEFGLLVREPVGVVGAIIPWNAPIGPDHLQAGSGPVGRLHGGAQVLTRGAGRRLRGGGNRRGHRPPGRRPQRGDRRPGGLRATGPRSPGGQDHLHRVDGGRPADRLDLRRTDRPLHPRARAASRPHSSSTTWTWARRPPRWPGPSACWPARCVRP